MLGLVTSLVWYLSLCACVGFLVGFAEFGFIDVFVGCRRVDVFSDVLRFGFCFMMVGLCLC